MTTHAQVLRDAGIKLVRIDVELPVQDKGRSLRRAEKLSKSGIHVMAIVKSRCFSPYLGGRWKRRWEEYVEKVAATFDPYVDYWQIGNELNHPYHSFLPSLRRRLRAELIERGCKVVKDRSNAKTVVNIYSFSGPDLVTLRYLMQLDSLATGGTEIDILGVDIYRSTWSLGGPQMYAQDLLKFKSHWSGNILVTETGFYTDLFGRTNTRQDHYFKSVFQELHNDSFVQDNNWFLGTLVYVYGCDVDSMHPEHHFGLLNSDGTRKSAWVRVIDEAESLRSSRLLFGVTSHVDEYEESSVCPKLTRPTPCNRLRTALT